jgi:hypothetical protein
MAKRDPIKTARNKRIRDVKDQLRALLPTVLKETGFTCEASLNAKIGGSADVFIDLKNEVIHSPGLSLSESWLALAGYWCFRFGGGNQTIANSSLAGELASAANSFRFLPDFSFRRLFIGGPELHLSEYSLALHFFL